MRLFRAIPALLGFWFVALPGLAQQPPSQTYGELFRDVQMQRVFPDGKTFVDAEPKAAPGEILRLYAERKDEAGFDLAAFVRRYFTPPATHESGYRSVPGQDVCSHIDGLWDVLKRPPDRPDPRSSLLPLPNPYVVPGGRFGEVYYWDSYFTMLGLIESGRDDLAHDVLANFASLIDRYGHIPNGNRSYYLSRSQPPFFAAMVELVAESSDDPGATYAAHLPSLAREYAFWMDGADSLEPGAAHRRVVRLPDGTLLNRYWDDSDQPRDESYREDVETARATNRAPVEVYRDLRAAAESGWDFSSRWLADGKTLATIRTTAVVPPDLNSLMAELESVLAKAYAASHRPERAAELEARARLRAEAVRRLLWDQEAGVFTDYLWREGRRTGAVTLATAYPLFFDLADPDQAARVAETLERRLLAPGGLLTTEIASGQQWDAPNGWAPLEWIAIRGLARTGHDQLAETVARRWAERVAGVYTQTGKLTEKYDVAGTEAAGGGEYPNQDGFGWTNGVLRRLLATYPQLTTASGGDIACLAAANDNRAPEAQPLRRPP
ncbi:alpha,alpha-trehalase TreF [Inquilinus sp. Marseille-Q2685]|uniref:alpha,alpha-trehalase TreF n=1 Tax=Inquilinus sp. Marseille-Q2685 TaxID=2866581 RepID=UPI001CE48ABD|nr:alpha,alpha-trehalase TreF [Inquilinus sp. Marseille-Q2685]